MFSFVFTYKMLFEVKDIHYIKYKKYFEQVLFIISLTNDIMTSCYLSYHVHKDTLTNRYSE